MAKISKSFDWCSLYGITTVDINIIDSQSLTIYNSFKITKRKHIKEVIKWLKEEEATQFIVTQPLSVLIAEWQSHNLLYIWNIEPERTIHLDITKEMKTWEKLGYLCFSLFYWLRYVKF
jgi:hypothetical protein